MIDNYLYMYHTDTLVVLPLYPEQIQDSMTVEYADNKPLSRTAPIYSYVSSGPRTFQVELPLHRDMMNQVNTEMSVYRTSVPELHESDYVDIMIKQLQACALPVYAASEKMVNPPLVAIRFGNDIFCKGVINGPVSVTYSGPILANHKYGLVTVSFSYPRYYPYHRYQIHQFRSYQMLLTMRTFLSDHNNNRM